MPLQPVEPTEVVLANQVAQRVIQQITQTAQNVVALRTTGIPATEAREAQAMPDGRVIPARQATAGVSAEAINAALGEANCALLDQIKTALGL